MVYRVDIDQRQEEANSRLRVGDTVIGAMHKGAIVTLDERVSKLRLALPMIGKFAEDRFDVHKGTDWDMKLLKFLN